MAESRGTDHGDGETMDFHSLLGAATRIQKTRLLRWTIKGLCPRSGMGKHPAADAPAGGRLTRKDVWKKYGRQMHFLTLEFEDDMVECDFRNDYLRRHKRLVEYGSLSIALAAGALGLQHLFGVSNFAAEPIMFVAPLFFLKWVFIVTCRQKALIHFQTAIRVCCMLSITVMVMWIIFGMPRRLDDFDRPRNHYCAAGHGECGFDHSLSKSIVTNNTKTNTSTSDDDIKHTKWTAIDPTTNIEIFLILIVAVYRIRFTYLLQMVIWSLSLYEISSVVTSCMPYDSHGFKDPDPAMNGRLLDPSKKRDLRFIIDRVGPCPTHLPQVTSTIFVSLLLCVLAYTVEVLQRKDFIMANMVSKESKRSDALLQNILPGCIVEKLKDKGGGGMDSYEACAYDEVTVLFADVVSFTTMSAMIDPPTLVALLNQMFTAFDEIAVQNGVEKIKTIGDCYMAATGVPTAMRLHAKAMARFGLQMLAKVKEGSLVNPKTGEPIQVRVGMHSGPCVAGVIGHKKFAYDIWGDAVNTASRMESHGKPMHLHCSAATRALICDDFTCMPREVMKVKGKGEMQTYFVESEKAHAANRAYVASSPANANINTAALADALEQAREVVPPEKLNELITTFTNQIRKKLRIGRARSSLVNSDGGAADGIEANFSTNASM